MHLSCFMANEATCGDACWDVEEISMDDYMRYMLQALMLKSVMFKISCWWQFPMIFIQWKTQPSSQRYLSFSWKLNRYWQKQHVTICKQWNRDPIHLSILTVWSFSSFAELKILLIADMIASIKVLLVAHTITTIKLLLVAHKITSIKVLLVAHKITSIANCIGRYG